MVVLKSKRKRTTEDEGDKSPKNKAPKQDITEDEETNSKTTKSHKASEFDVKYFRKQLNMKPVQLVGLTQFVEVCTRPNSSVDYMMLYLENGGNANEILKILDYQNKKNPAISTPVFHLLQLMFIKIRTSCPNLLQAAEETCRYFLNSYVSTVDFTLSEKSNAKQQKMILKLLTAIVTLSPELGFTVLNQLSLQPKTLIHLVKPQQGKEKDDVRVSFVHFVMSFLLDGNTPLIKSALDKHGLITLIIPGLVRDNMETVLMVLNTFSKNVIHNLSISKTIKIKTFNQNIILSIFNLFNWIDNSLDTEGEKINSKKEIEDAVFDFLFVLCTSHKHGIYFTDKSLGTSDVPTSQYLWKALESLEAPWNNDRAGQLVIMIVSKCPDLYRPVIRLVEQSFDPRNSELWYKTTTFLMNLLMALPAKHVIPSMTEMNAIQITNFVRNVYLPIPILKMSLNAMNLTDDAVRNKIIVLLHVMLSSIRSYLLILSFEKSNVQIVLKSRLEDFIPKHFPSTDILITVLHSMLDHSSTQEIGKEEPSSSFKIPLPSKSRLLINVLELLLLYDEVLPNSLDPISTMLDSKRLFDKMESISDTGKGELKLKVTMFLLCADKFAFAPEKPLFKEILQSMFEVFITSDPSISGAARNVLYSILETTGIFEKSRAEIDLLLSVIKYVGLKYGGSIAEAIVDVVEKINLYSDKYISNLASFSVEEENVEGLISHFDILIENLQYCNERAIDTNIVYEKSFLTHFVIGLLESLKSKSSDSFRLLTNLFIIHLLHFQDSPENIWYILDKYTVDSPVKKYVLGWKSKPVVLSNDFIQHSVLQKLNYALLSDEKIDLETIFDAESFPKIVSNINSFNTVDHNISCLSEDESAMLSWFNMILFYITRQGALNTLSECKLSNCTQALRHVLLKTKGDGNNGQSTKVLRSMIGNCLSHKILLKMFSPFKSHTHVSEKHVFDFILEFVQFCRDHNIESAMFDSLLRPYRHQIFLSLMSHIKKSSKYGKGPTLHNVSQVLSTISLDFNDATFIITNILQLDVVYMVSDENEASSWVYVLCHIINQFTKDSKILPLEILKGIALLYSKMITGLDLVINITDFEESFYNYLIANPETVISIPSAAFEAIFSVKHVSKFTSNIGSLLLRVNVNLLQKFCKNVTKHEILDKRELVLPLTTAAFSHFKFNSCNDIIQIIYDNYKTNIQKVIEKPHKASQIYIDNSELIVKLINKCMDKTDCEQFLKKVHKFDSVEIFHINILEAIFFKAQNDCLNDTYLTNYLLCVLQLANIALKRDTQHDGKLFRVYSCLQQFLFACKTEEFDFNTFSAVRDSAIWQNFYKSVLKYYLQTDAKENIECRSDETALFSVVPCLIHLIYPNDHDDILNLFEMVSSHSEFLNIMLSNHYTDVKTQLVKLLFVMVLKNKAIMKPTHTTVYLSAYHASLNMSDKYILALLRFYERNGQSMTEYQPYLWGDTAANHYAVRSKRTKSSLWSNPTANHILNLLDKEIIEKTIRYFPTAAKLNIEEDLINDVDYLFGISNNKKSAITCNIIEDSLRKKSGKGLSAHFEKLTTLTGKMKLQELKLVFNDLLKTESSIELDTSIDDSDIYDPAFLLPLLNFVVTPGSAVSCHRIVRGGVLAIPLVALSSNCPYMRAAALNILQRFYALLESEMYYRNDKVLWSQFIDTLKSSLDSALPNSESEQQVFGLSVPRLPGVSALYLARSALIMTHPLDPMFKPINNFIISKQYINFSVVPDLLDLFHNTDIHYVERRTWILKILRDGVKSFADVKVLLKSVTFKIILDFYSSNLADIKQKLLVLEILNSSICIPKAAKILTDGYGLFAWLSCSFRSIHYDNKSLISMAITLVSNLWLSLACESLSKVNGIMDLKYDENVIDSITNKSFKIGENIQSDILCLLMDLASKLSGGTLPDARKYFNILRKISKSSINNITKSQMLTLVNQCNYLFDFKKVLTILTMVIENTKADLLFSSYSVLEFTPHNTGDEYFIVKYLHEITMSWVS